MLTASRAWRGQKGLSAVCSLDIFSFLRYLWSVNRCGRPQISISNYICLWLIYRNLSLEIGDIDYVSKTNTFTNVIRLNRKARKDLNIFDAFSKFFFHNLN